MGINTNSKHNVQVSQLFYYPVKSLRGIAQTSQEIDALGPLYDRRWMLVDDNGHFITQREEASLCLLNTQLDRGVLTIRADSFGSCQLTVDDLAQAGGTTRLVTVWVDTLAAIDCGDEAAQYFSAYLDRPCRLVFMRADQPRQVDPDYVPAAETSSTTSPSRLQSHPAATVSFADGFPLLLISEASLRALNEKLEHSVSMQRFRPNIVVSGCEAFAEDQWRSIQIGALYFDVVKPCSRCSIPAIDPASAERHASLNRVLASFRRVDKKILFGQNLIHRSSGKIALGDELRIIS